MPGIRGGAEPSPTPKLDLVCMHAAACDLAIVDEGFRYTVSTPGTGMTAALLKLYELAQPERPNDSEAEGLVLLMDFQFARFMAAGISVRTSLYDSSLCDVPASRRALLCSERVRMATYRMQALPVP